MTPRKLWSQVSSKLVPARRDPSAAVIAKPASSMQEAKVRWCRDEARSLVHKYAAFGTAWAVLPIPVATSAGLTALETHLIYWVARIYGDSPSKGDVFMIAAGLELASIALKTVAIEGANFVPVIGWGVKGVIAGSAIEAIGAAIIGHFESKYPNRVRA
jgi:uncharacterized protein (DUF697 family)